MHRHALTDEQWNVVKVALPRQRRGPDALLGDRSFIDAVIYRARTGIPWRDLPERFGPWKSIYNRFRNWSLAGHWERIFKALRVEVDEEGCIVDGTSIRAHQDASGGKGGSKEMRWVVLEVDSPRKSMRSSTRQDGRSTSRSRRGSDTT
jgi:transposase